MRRHWPTTLISWSRLLAGGFRDPLVGRALLVGCAAGSLMPLLKRLNVLLPGWMGAPPATPFGFSSSLLLGPNMVVGAMLDDLASQTFGVLAMLFLLLVLRLLLRRTWAAAGAFVAIFTTVVTVQSETPLAIVVLVAAYFGILVFLIVRFGLVAGIAALLTAHFLTSHPITPQFSAWYAGSGLFNLAVVAAIALYGFYTSLGGQPMFGAATLED